MQESFQETGFLRWRRAFPWLHLLRIPGIAFRTQILFAGFLAVFFHFVCSLVASTIGLYTSRLNEMSGLSDHGPLSTLQNLFRNSITISEQAVAPNVAMFELMSRLSALEFTSLVFIDLLYLLNYLFFGLIICRMACAEFTKGTGICLERSSIFAVKKLPAVMTGILFPFLFIAILFAFASAILAAENIPVIGPSVGGILYGLSIPLLFFATILTLGLVIGWPMIVAVIACENSDSFDAFSRTFDYLRSRLVVIMIAFVLTISAGVFILACAEEISRFTINWLNTLQSSIVSEPLEAIQARSQSTFGQGANGFQQLWLTLWSNLLHGYLIAFYWCTICGIYVLTRHSVDRIPVDEFQQ